MTFKVNIQSYQHLFAKCAKEVENVPALTQPTLPLTLPLSTKVYWILEMQRRQMKTPLVPGTLQGFLMIRSELG